MTSSPKASATGNPDIPSRWSLDEMHVDIGGVNPSPRWKRAQSQLWARRGGLWPAALEHGAVLDVFLQEHRDIEAAGSFFHRLLGEYEVPEVIHTDKLWGDGAALREFPVLHPVEHVQIISTARCHHLIEPSHRPTRRRVRQQRGFRSRHRAQGFLNLHARITNLHHPARSTVSVPDRRHHQQAAVKVWRETVWQAA